MSLDFIGSLKWWYNGFATSKASDILFSNKLLGDYGVIAKSFWWYMCSACFWQYSIPRNIKITRRLEDV